MLQPVELNKLLPAMASDVLATALSRGGAFVARMKAVNALMSSSGSSPHVPDGGLLHATLSGLRSYPVPNPTNTPIDVFSTRLNRLVMPISFKYASDEN